MTSSNDTGRRTRTDVAVRAAAWSVAMQWGVRLVQFGAFLGLARMLDPASFGTFALAMAIVVLLDVSSGLGLAEAVTQWRDPEEDELRSAHWLAIVSAVLVSVVVAIVSLVVAATSTSSLASVVAVLAPPALVLRAFRTVPEAVLRRELDFRRIARAHLSATVVGAGLGLVLAALGAGTGALIGQVLATAALTTIGVRRSSPWHPASPAERLAGLGLVSVGWKIGAAGLLNAVNKRTDDLLLGAHHPASTVGHYATGYTLSELAESGITGALGQVALPAFAGVEGDRGRLRDRFLRAVEISAVVAFPIFATLAAFAAPAVAVLLGSRWSDAAPVLAIIATMSMIRSVGHFNGPLLIAVGRADTMLSIMVGQAVASIVVFSLVAPVGIVAMAWAVLARVALSLPVTLLAIRRHVGVTLRSWLQRTAPPFGCAALAAVAARLAIARSPLDGSDLVELTSGVLLSLLVFGAMMAVVRPGVVAGAADSVLGRHGDGGAP